MYRLTIEPIGETIEVEDGQSVLDACLRAGVFVPHACCHGRCSTCKVDVLEGDVDAGPASSFALMDFEREEGKRLACVATLRSDATIEADIEEDEDALYLPVEDYVGKVVERRMLTPTILGLTLEVEDDGIEFQAGQYVQLQVPGVERPRAFSMASSPSRTTRIELQIKRVPEGEGTTVLHEEVAVGDELPFSGPYGHFFVRHSHKRPVLLLAGGSGLSALRSMLFELAERREVDRVFLFHGARSFEELHCREELEALASDWPGLTYVPTICGEVPSDWTGELGRVDEVLPRHFPDGFAGHTAYVCGPPPMIEACIRTMMQGRLFEEHIYTEKFLTAANADAAGAKSPLFKRI